MGFFQERKEQKEERARLKAKQEAERARTEAKEFAQKSWIQEAINKSIQWLLLEVSGMKCYNNFSMVHETKRITLFSDGIVFGCTTRDDQYPLIKYKDTCLDYGYEFENVDYPRLSSLQVHDVGVAISAEANRLLCLIAKENPIDMYSDVKLEVDSNIHFKFPYPSIYQEIDLGTYQFEVYNDNKVFAISIEHDSQAREYQRFFEN